MHGSSSASPRLRALLTGALGTLALTTVHHSYGAFRYHTPWRHHVAAVALVVGAALLATASTYRRAPETRRGRRAGWILTGLALICPVLLIGAFEGLYNHALKDALYFAGAPRPLLVRLFPPPTYEMPDDVLFEATGVLQAAVAGYAAWALLGFVRELRSTRPRPLEAGSVIAPREWVTISGETVRVPDPERAVHLQFRRFAGCPVCDLHLQTVARRHPEISAAGIREVVLFHSSAEELRPHVAHLPFAVVADPEKALYREFGVESGPRALLDPRAWLPVARAVLRSAVGLVRGTSHLPAWFPHGGRLGLPADALIAPDGRVIACKYGEHVYDQWSVDELLALARQTGEQAGSRAAGPAFGALEGSDGHA